MLFCSFPDTIRLFFTKENILTPILRYNGPDVRKGHQCPAR